MVDNEARLEILVADPDEGSALALKGELSRQGWVVEASTDLASVPEAVQRGAFRIAIVDVAPEGGGVDLIERLHKIDRDLCVIAMTALASVPLAVAAMRHSAFSFLAKPIDSEELQRVIAEAIREGGWHTSREELLNSAIGQRVRESRKREELTLKQVSRRTGLSVSLISQIELGKSAPSISSLYKLSTALRVPMAHFVETV